MEGDADDRAITERSRAHEVAGPRAIEAGEFRVVPVSGASTGWHSESSRTSHRTTIFVRGRDEDRSFHARTEAQHG